MRQQRGAVLLLAVMLLFFIAGMTLLLRALNSVALRTPWPGEATNKLRGVDEALKAFAISFRRLPCPADGRIVSGTAGVGMEVRDANGDCTAQGTGVVPWVTLGLPEAQVTDAWGGRFTYRVPTGGQGLTRNGALDATNCDPVGTMAALTNSTANTAVACANTCARSGIPPVLDPANCTPPGLFLAGRGLIVSDAAGTKIRDPNANSGAAYVVISHGPEGGGAYSGAGVVIISAVAAGVNGEVRNLNNQGIPVAGFFDAPAIQTGNNAGAAHFDDVLSYPSIAEMLAKTGLGARSH